MVDAKGERLGMWPVFRTLPDAPRPIDKAKKPNGSATEPQEFLGYLEWGGYFGHVGGWPMQFTIVEVYPAGADKAKRTGFEKQYLERLDKESYDWPISEYPAETDELRRIRANIQGAWVLSDVQGDDGAFMFRGGKGTRWIITGDRLKTGSPGQWTRGTVRFDPTRKPALLDFCAADDGPYAFHQRTVPGIVSLDGDTLQVCLSEGYTGNRSMENPRPRRFASDNDSRTALFTLRRDRGWSPPSGDAAAVPDDPDCIAALEKSLTHLEHDDQGNVVVAQFGYVQLHGPTETKDADFAPCAGLHHLERIEMDLGRLTDAGLASIAHCRSLVYLEIGGKGITDAGLDNLRGLVRLEDLALRDTNITDAGLSKLKDLKRLKRFTLKSRSVTGSGLSFLAGCSELEYLELSGPRVEDDIFRYAARFPALKTIELCETNVGDSRAEGLGSCANLEGLYLNDTKFGDAGMRYVRSLHKLKDLRLAHTKVTDAGMSSLKGLDSLDSINATETQVGDVGVSHLNGLKNLKDLYLGRTRVSDAGLKALTDLPNLKCLNLSDTAVTSAGVKSLARLPCVESLGLQNTQFDDGDLECLRSFPNLRSVSLAKPRVTRQAAEAIAKQLPKVTIWYDHGYLQH